MNQTKLTRKITMTKKLKVLSLFSNIGVAEAYLEDIGVDVVVANELIPRRAALYSKIYPKTNMICGDITLDSTMQSLISESKAYGVNLIMATPPCQGMSTVGKQEEDDVRNSLFIPVLKLVLELKPQYVFFENVPMLLQTMVSVDGTKMYITDYIKNVLGELYHISINRIDTSNFSVPQTRERAIILMSRKDMPYLWEIPEKDAKKVTMRDAIGHLPSIDPFVRDVSREQLLTMFPEFEKREAQALAISPWNFPPVHIQRQVEIMRHTPTGCTAFDNDIKFRPVKANGAFVKGFKNTYKRQEWDIPAYTVTMDNRKISSQNNVHPGRLIGNDDDGNPIYSDARALTIYELMKIMSLPDGWNLPLNTQPAFLRSVIGEGIPPLFVKKTFELLTRHI